MKLSFHQHIALFWMIGAPGVFAPVIEERQAARCRRRHGGWGVAIVAVMILFALAAALSTIPALVLAGRMRCRSGSARRLPPSAACCRYYQTAFDDGCVPA